MLATVEGVIGHRVEDAELDVRERTDRQRGAVGAQPFDQRRIFETAHAVVDAPRSAQSRPQICFLRLNLNTLQAMLLVCYTEKRL